MINDKLKQELYYFFLFVMFIALLGAIATGYVGEIDVGDIGASEKVIELKALPVTPTILPTASPVPETTESRAEELNDGQDEVVGLIEEVFGEHTDKAMLLLKGRGPGTCAENPKLDPKAVNYNRGSTDFGVFQINDHWNGFKQPSRNDDFLFDPEINVRIAWRLYEDNDYTFRLWTCGRYYGI